MPRVAKMGSSSRALETREKELWQARLKNWGKTSLVIIASGLTFAAFSLFVMDKLFAPKAFQIQELEISGKFRYLQPQEIEEVLKQQSLGNFFSVDLERIRKDIGDMKWVAEVGVRRHWPNKLVVWVREHRPVALWKDIGDSASEGSNEWVTSEGTIIQANLPNSISSKADVLVGSRARSTELLEQNLHWKRLLAPMGLELKQLQLSRSGAWSMKLARHQSLGTFDLLLGQSDLDSRMQRFLSLYLGRFQGRAVELSRVDARYPNGLAIEVKEKQSSSEELGMAPTNSKLKARVI